MHTRFERLRDIQALDPAETLTTYATSLLKRALESCQHQSVQLSDENHGTVTAFGGNKLFIVDFIRETCTCGHFQQHGVPCGHAIACLHLLQQSPRDRMPYNLTVAAMKAMYTGNHRGIDSSRLAILPGAAEITNRVPCLAPQLKNPRGRPKGRPATARKERGVGNRVRLPNFPDHAPQRCSKCNLTGHNRRRCRAPPAL